MSLAMRCEPQLSLLPCETQLKVERAKVDALLADRDEVITRYLVLQAEVETYAGLLQAALNYCEACSRPAPMPAGSYTQDNRIQAYQSLIEQFKKLNGEQQCL